jgi:hypothetical protein
MASPWIGNDIVDLAHGEAISFHPRFPERVLAPREFEYWNERGRETRLLWTFWTAKETALKALRRRLPHTIFSPRRFELDLARGVVLHPDAEEPIPVEFFQGESFVHAACVGNRVAIRSVSSPASCLSLETRRLARDILQNGSAIAPSAAISFLRGPGGEPQAFGPVGIIPRALSFAHHGSMVSVSYTD